MRSFLFGIVVAIAAFAQEDTSRYKASCVPSQTGCGSYNEMLEKHDSEVLSSLSGHSYVCFREFEDTFFMVAYREPNDALFRKTAQKGVSEEGSLLRYRRFKNGQSDESRSVFGKWIKTDYGGGIVDVDFEPSSRDNSVSISDAEIAFGYRFTNLNGSTTQYQVKIRRSTLRFTETWQWPKSSKDKAGPQATPAAERNEESGTCVEFTPWVDVTPDK